MGDQLQQVYLALTAFPGNIVYHIIVNFSILNALISAGSTQRSRQHPTRKRTIFGLGVLMGIRILVFAYSVISVPLFTNSIAILPILDWLSTTFSVIIIIWLWLFPDRFQLADASVSVLFLLTMILAILSGGWWLGEYSGLCFNQSILDDGWNLYGLTLLAIGIVLILMRTPINFGSGLGMLATLLAGHLLHLIIPNITGNFPGGVRLFQMAAYPLLFTLSQRVDSHEEEPPIVNEEPIFVEDTGPYRINPEEFRHIISLFDDFSPMDVIRLVTRIVAEIMKADICFSIKHTSGRHFVLQGGYDRHNQRDIDDIRLHEKQLPLLVTSYHKSASLRLQASSTSPDLYNLGKALGLTSTGHLMGGFFPAIDNNGIILLTPHSNKRWDQENQKYFVEISNSLFTIFQDVEHYYIHAEDDDIEIIPDPDARREGKLQKETLLKLINFLKRQKT
ncbi:MAG: hypothetical protein ISS57_15965 [Anaerolineales bacterium]|nr:hypothetical protein [Anaerolineales bacterium]